MTISPDPTAYHLVPAHAWAESDPEAPFRPASLDAEGFVHLTHRIPDLVDVANEFYRQEPGPHVVLTIELSRLSSPWRYDGDERYPHVYGPLDRTAIAGVQAMGRDSDGTFRGPAVR